MSIGPLGFVGSVAGTPLQQAAGSDVDRTAQETANQARQTQSDVKAEQAAGIGQTEEDSETEDRDADGRRPWEITGRRHDAPEEETDAAQDEAADQPRSLDPSGDSGNEIDLSG